MPAAVDVSGLRKSYGDHEAVRGITFRIEEGEVFCLLGPNGAGKTTTVEILEGYRARDAGDVTVLGLDPGRRERTLRERMGVVLQHSETWPQVTVAETLRIYAGYYKDPRDVGEVIELVGLVEKRDARIKTLSGGQKRRLDLGLALVGNPDLVFLDEPTTGFDPQARRNAWEMIRGLRALGKTILLTTHYLDEAQQLADRVAVLRDGVIVTEGTPAELVSSSRTEIRYRENGEVKVVETDEPTRALHELTSRAVAQGRELEELEVSPALARGRVPRAASRGRRLRLFLHQVRADQLVFWRGRESAIFVFLFPVLLYLLLSTVYSGEYRGRPNTDYLTSSLIAYGVANTAFGGLAIILVMRRELGILKRIRATPLPAPMYLAAALCSILLVFVLQATTIMVLGRLFYDWHLPEQWPSLFAGFLLGALCFAGMGFGAASLIRSGEGASAVVNVVILPMTFLSGGFGPTTDYPSVLQAIADVLPLTYLVDIVQGVVYDGTPIWEQPTAVAVLLAWGLAGTLTAVRYFAWEPRER